MSNPERKPALLAEVVEYLLDKPLSGLTFRTLAEGLGVSTYTLVYHFGSRAELVREIVQAVSERQLFVVTAVANEPGDIGTHLANIRNSWELSLNRRNLQLQRLEFEAALFDGGRTGGGGNTAAMFDRWHRAGVEALERMGMAQADAELEARVLVDTIYGLHYDLIVTGDAERVSAAFGRVVEGYGQRVVALLGAAALADDLLDQVS
ncbi:MAG: transcriptional regulator, TetR family protein [Microbacteriaceae bacterium]|jgi:AcrR family transcriptional regulator|nr:transcriptional regulator, TetR family protein [Microbacteriaceae bacterium]